MSSSSPAPTVQTTQASTPWQGAQPALQQAISGAQNLYGNDIGFAPYGGPMQATVDPRTAAGLENIVGLAQGERYGSAGVNAAVQQALAMQQNQGLTSGQQNFVIPGMQNVYTQASTQENPYLQAQIEANNRRIADKINAGMSAAGRYGSGAHTDVMARSLAEAANPLLAQDYAMRQQLRMQALGGLQGVYGGGLDVMGKYAQLIPTLEEARYAPSDRMLGVGQYYMDREQQALANQIAQWNAAQARPWEQISRLNAIASGAGGLGGTKVTTTPSTAPPLSSRILGGAIAGGGLGSMFGLPGAGIGALGGGLLGLL